MRSLRPPAAREAGAHRRRDDADLRAAREPARHPVGQGRARGPRVQVPLPRRVRAARRRRREDARRAPRVHPRRREAHPEGDDRERRAVRGDGPRQAPVVDLPEDEADAAPVRGDPRRDRLPRDHRHADALLPGARRRAPDVDADPRPLQGLHRAAQAEPLPVAAHRGDRPARRAHRDPDPHRRRCTCVAEHGIAAHWKYKEGKPARRSSDEKKFAWLRQLMESAEGAPRSDRVPRVGQDRPVRRRGLRVHARAATSRRCRKGAARSTSRTRCTRRSATTARARASTA